MSFKYRDYKAILPFMRSRRSGFDKLVPHILEGLDKESSVIDVGCGDGRIAALVASKTKCRVSAIDTSPDAVADTLSFIADRKLEKYVDVSHLSWEHADTQSYDKILAIHLFYHLDSRVWPEFLDWALKHLNPGGQIVLVTTSATSELQNFFVSNNIIRNMVDRKSSLESAYGNYIFGEDVENILDFDTAIRYRTEFTISWPYSAPSLKFKEDYEIEYAWLKLFSFVYRLSPQLIKEEFGPILEERLASKDMKLTIQGGDLVHVITKK